jgi:hypothetical protein
MKKVRYADFPGGSRRLATRWCGPRFMKPPMPFWSARRDFPLRKWALGIAKRAGMRKAKVALARKLAMILHRMLVDGTPFDAAKAAAAA